MKHTFALFIFAIGLLAQNPVQGPVTILPEPAGDAAAVQLREGKASGTNYIAIKAPPTLAADRTLQLPATYGTLGQALVTDGAGTLSWSTVAGGNMPVCTSTTGNDTYTCTVVDFTAYSAGYCIVLNVDTANTGPATVNITAVGAQSILRYGGSALVDNDILANSPVWICYDGTNFQLPPSASPGSGAFLNGGNSFGADATLGTNDTYSLNIETDGVTQWTIDPSGHLSSSGTQRLDMNGLATIGTAQIGYTGIVPSPISGTALHVVANTGAVPRILVDAFTAAPNITMRGANGSPTSPTATLNGDGLLSLTGRGRGATAYSSGGRSGLFSFATENWTDSAQGADLRFYTTTNGTTSLSERLRIEHNGNLMAGTDGAHDFGAAASGRLSNVFITGTYTGANFAGAPSGGTGNYVSTRKLNVVDSTGGAGFWDLQATASMAANSVLTLRDNAGSRLLVGQRAISGSPVNSTQIFSTFVPALRATADGDAVNDATLPALGASSARWSTAYINILDASASLTLVPSGTASLGASGNDWNRLWVGGAEVLSFVRPQVDNGAVNGGASRRWSATYTVNLQADGTITFPTGAVNGYVWTSDGSGNGSWQSAACATCFVQGGNNFGTDAVLGTNSANSLQFETNNTLRWSIISTGSLYAVTDGAYDIGAVANYRPSNVYITGTYTGANFNGAPTGSTGNYVRTRKLSLYDNTGSTSLPGEWDMNCVASGIGVFSESYCYMRDNSGNTVWQIERVRSGSTVTRTYWNTSFLPGTTGTYSLGSSLYRWSDVHTNTLYVNNTVGSSLNPSPSGTYTLGAGGALWFSVAALSAQFTNGMELGGSVTFSSAGTVGIGTNSVPGNHFFANYMTTKLGHYIPSGGQLILMSGSSTASNGNSGVTVSGASCTVKRIDNGIVTDATCP